MLSLAPRLRPASSRLSLFYSSLHIFFRYGIFIEGTEEVKREAQGGRHGRRPAGCAGREEAAEQAAGTHAVLARDQPPHAPSHE